LGSFNSIASRLVEVALAALALKGACFENYLQNEQKKNKENF
jgi:hypothetical protein